MRRRGSRRRIWWSVARGTTKGRRNSGGYTCSDAFGGGRGRRAQLSGYRAYMARPTPAQPLQRRRSTGHGAKAGFCSPSRRTPMPIPTRNYKHVRRGRRNRKHLRTLLTERGSCCALWEAAEDKEIASLIKHQVYDLVPIPAGSKIIGSRWVFKIKADDTHKAVSWWYSVGGW